MDDLIKNIKKKLSVDNLVEMMKDAKIIDDTSIKEEDVRRTLGKIDPNNLIDVDELAAKLNDISEQSRADNGKSQASKIIEKAKSSLGVISKSAEKEEKSYGEVEDNVSGFLD